MHRMTNFSKRDHHDCSSTDSKAMRVTQKQPFIQIKKMYGIRISIVIGKQITSKRKFQQLVSTQIFTWEGDV